MNFSFRKKISLHSITKGTLLFKFFLEVSRPPPPSIAIYLISIFIWILSKKKTVIETYRYRKIRARYFWNLEGGMVPLELPRFSVVNSGQITFPDV